MTFLRQNIAEKVSHKSFDLQYLGVLHIVEKKTNHIFGIVMKFRVRNLPLCKNSAFRNWLFLPDLDPTSLKSQLWWCHRVRWPSRYLRVKWPESMCHTAFSSELLGPDLDIDLFRYDLWTHAASFSDIYQHFLGVWAYDLCTFAASFSDIYQHFLGVWALCCPSNRTWVVCQLQPKMWKRCFLTWPHLDLIRDLYLKMLSVH